VVERRDGEPGSYHGSRFDTGKTAAPRANVQQGRRGHTVPIGWRPTCTCNAGDPVPCIVLDPFAGAGTTVLVADRLGRRGIGVELKGEYTRMGRDRVFNDAPLLALMETA